VNPLHVSDAVRVFEPALGYDGSGVFNVAGEEIVTLTDLVRLLGELDALEWPQDPLLGDTTVNLGSLAGGVADNVIAPEAEARLMIRLVTPPEETLALVRQWVGDRADVMPGPTVPPVRLRTVPGFPTSVAAYATDIPALDNWGAPYLFGPGSIHVAHRDDEHVMVEELRAAVAGYERLAVEAMERSA
jgi:acetylornithine deacetylase